MKTKIQEHLDAGVSLVSFDVFDTVVTRRTYTPKGIFMAMGRRLITGELGLPPGLAESFVEARATAERKLYGTLGATISLRDIYSALQKEKGLTSAQTERLLAEEVRLEYEFSSGIPEVVSVLHDLFARQVQVVFTSDMYLSREVVFNLLVKAGLRVERDHVLVSSELGKCKSDGSLFDYILGEFGLAPGQVLHVGDNLHSDVKVPRDMGLRCIHYGGAQSRGREADLISSKGLDGELLAGAARIARLGLEAKGTYPDATRLGVEFAGPMFAPYVGWILAKIFDSGGATAYFVARDGQVFQEIARVLVKDSGIGLELRYLYGSRQAWHLTGITSVDLPVIDWLCEADPHLTMEVLAKRLEMDIESFTTLVEQVGLSGLDSDRPLTPIEVEKVKARLCSAEVSARIVRHAKPFKDAALAYLKQEGVLDHNSVNIVDIGWNGRIQDSLSRVVSGHGIRIIGYYFGLKRAPRNNAVSEKNAYFYSTTMAPMFMQAAAPLNGILEILASADHGSTKGYRFDEKSNSWKAALYESENVSGLAWGHAELRTGIMAYATEFAAVSKWINRSEDDKESRISLQYMMKSLFSHPSRWEGTLIGGYLWSSDQSSSEFRRFAPPLSFMQAYHYVTSPSRGKRVRITSWVEGSCVQSGVCARLLLRCFVGFRGVITRVIRPALGGGQKPDRLV